MGPDDATTWQMTAAMAAGDPDAIRQFYDLYFDDMYQHARSATRRDQHFCLDVVQDSMLKVIKSIRPVESQQRLLQWTRAVVRHVAYDLLRSEIRRRQREVNAGASANDTAAVADLVELRDQIAWLREELDSLPAGSRRLLDARYQWGWTLARIGRELGIGPGAVDGRIRRLLTAIRQHYEKDRHE